MLAVTERTESELTDGDKTQPQYLHRSEWSVPDMTDCVDGVETLGGGGGPTSSKPALRMEDLSLAEKLDRTIKHNTG